MVFSCHGCSNLFFVWWCHQSECKFLEDKQWVYHFYRKEKRKGEREERRENHSNSPTNWLIPRILPLEFHSFILGFWPHELIWFCTHLSLRMNARCESHFLFKFWRKRTGERDRYRRGDKNKRRGCLQQGQALHASKVLWPPTTGSKLETTTLLILRWKS